MLSRNDQGIRRSYFFQSKTSKNQSHFSLQTESRAQSENDECPWISQCFKESLPLDRASELRNKTWVNCDQDLSIILIVLDRFQEMTRITPWKYQKHQFFFSRILLIVLTSRKGFIFAKKKHWCLLSVLGLIRRVKRESKVTTFVFLQKSIGVIVTKDMLSFPIVLDLSPGFNCDWKVLNLAIRPQSWLSFLSSRSTDVQNPVSALRVRTLGDIWFGSLLCVHDSQVDCISDSKDWFHMLLFFKDPSRSGFSLLLWHDIRD